MIVLKKVDKDYDPTDRVAAINLLEKAAAEEILITGLIYINPDRPTLTDIYDLTEIPLNRLPESRIRPSRESLEEINAMMF